VIAAVLLVMLLGRRVVSPAPDPDAARRHVDALTAALDRFREAHGRYPTTAEGLEALRVPYLPAGVPEDPWGRPYVYRSPGQADPLGYDLMTYGRDGRSDPGADTRDGDLYVSKARPTHVPAGTRVRDSAGP
jgi:hypothetical protein